ncbi:Glycosyltransferase involved in cell wall bisynthesis [Pseudoxanthobacter soli DSM 19599]|uniref:Glycosyltransferase involved in cell wall bisynthesis n=1 Tax=Pseudoxanthobacter soli DSM 19599 TaxID=1123029 RepID=A0A1M7ZBX8_9HYPH|nr:glycosyltransferase [Pseudoxanthobacter soli]SHO62319.1 Glycosyltransferase involved in cell wall bisynthesis [Pseudoxanthobacter soli DSM 19599]
MIIIAHGMPKSGSTFLYQVLGDLSYIHNNADAREIREKYLSKPADHYQDFYLTIDDEVLKEVVERIPADVFYVIKTHGMISDYAKEQAARGNIKIFYSYRDPRDVALSMLDAGRAERAQNLDRFFHQFREAKDVCDSIKLAFTCVEPLMNAPRLHDIPYFAIANNQTWVIEHVSDLLGMKPAAATLVEKYKPESNTDRIVEFNKGVYDRFLDELEPRDIKYLSEVLDHEIKLVDDASLTFAAREGFSGPYAELVAKRDRALALSFEAATLTPVQRLSRRVARFFGKPAAAPTPVSPAAPTVCIVTPVFNGAKFIDATIASVVNQVGDFVLHYHIQDGGSTDETAAIVDRWIRLNKSGLLPKFCREVHITFASEPDKGMYDAINKGVARALPPGPDVLMGWIGSDDLVAPGAFATIFAICRLYPDVRLIGGRVALLDEGGSITTLEPVGVFSRRCMSAGLYDGRAMPFIMQEGTFWFSSLWRELGGLDTSFRLAGDWDLWRRMARLTHYVSVDSVLGFHRRRKGQLSSQMDRYYAEVDRVLDEPYTEPSRVYSGTKMLSEPDDPPSCGRDDYDRIKVEFQRMRSDIASFPESPHAATAIRYDSSGRTWLRMDAYASPPRPVAVMKASGTVTRLPVLPTTGFLPPQGPVRDHYYLGDGCRWMNVSPALGEVIVPRTGRYMVTFSGRSGLPEQRLALSVDGRRIARFMPTGVGFDGEIEWRAECILPAGRRVFSMEAVDSAVSEAFFLLTGWWIEERTSENVRRHDTVDPVALPISAPLDGAGVRQHPRISVVVSASGVPEALDDTIRSVLGQGYPDLELIVAGGEGDEVRFVLDGYGRAVTHHLPRPVGDSGTPALAGLRRASGALLVWLEAGEVLFDGALHAAAIAASLGDDLIAGLCELHDDAGDTVLRRLPCLPAGTLSPGDVLDVEGGWLEGRVFDRPAVFFRREIFARVEGRLDEGLRHVSDFDLWARMAEAGARIRVIGYPIARRHVPPIRSVCDSEAHLAELVEHGGRLRAEFGMDHPSMPVRPPRHLKVAALSASGPGREAAAFTTTARALALLGHTVRSFLTTADDDADGLRSATRAIADGGFDAVLVDASALASGKPGGGFGLPTITCVDEPWWRSRDAQEGAGRLAAIGSSLVLTSEEEVAAVLGKALDVPVRSLAASVDAGVFTPGSRARARQLLALPEDHLIVVMDGSNAAGATALLPVLSAAAAALRSTAATIVVVDSDSPPPDGFGQHNGALPVVSVATDAREETVALYCQAADIAVLPSARHPGRIAIEAAACGTPVISFAEDGTVQVCPEARLGMRTCDAGALTEAIGRLAADAALRWEVGVHGRLNAINGHCLEMGAVRLLTLLESVGGLGLGLPPIVNLTTAPASLSIASQVFASGIFTASEPWIPVAGIARCASVVPAGQSTAVAEDSAGGLCWLGSNGVLLLRAEEDGDHLVQLCGYAGGQGEQLSIVVNGGPPQVAGRRTPASEGLVEFRLRARLRAGFNRMEFSFSAAAPFSDPGQAYALVALRAWRASENLSGYFIDGQTRYERGFGAAEGPFPQFGLPKPFYWMAGLHGEVWLRSAVQGSREIELQVRNNNPGQTVEVRLGGLRLGTFSLQETDIGSLIRLRCKASFDIGDHPLAIEASRMWPADASGRELSFMIEDIVFVDEE